MTETKGEYQAGKVFDLDAELGGIINSAISAFKNREHGNFGLSDADSKKCATHMTNIRLVVDALRQRAEAAEAEIKRVGDCRWSAHVPEEYWESMWHGECGIEFILMEGGPEHNEMNFCPKCGRKIIVGTPSTPAKAATDDAVQQLERLKESDD